MKTYDYDACYKIALQYSSKGEFQRKSKYVYEKARLKNWLKDYTWFIPIRKPKGYWTYEKCYEEAKKYTKFNDFLIGCKPAFCTSYNNGWLDDFTWLGYIKKPNNYWNEKTCYEEAKKYKTRNTFAKGSRGAYHVAWKNGWLDDYSWFIGNK